MTAWQFKLQQYLPFTVLKLPRYHKHTTMAFVELQQYLPFTVLKRVKEEWQPVAFAEPFSCNSTYRLRY